MPDVNVRAKAPSSLEHQLSESQRPIPGGSCRPYQATEYARTGFGARARIESLGPAQLVRQRIDLMPRTLRGHARGGPVLARFSRCKTIDVAIVGGGQAGLATSYHLSQRGVEHVVLERGRIGQTWRDRWDTFCLVTPNWSVQLPGRPYDGDDPDGYMPRDEIVTYLEDVAAKSGAPVREGVDVTGVRRHDGRFDLVTSAGGIRARALVLASGAYENPQKASRIRKPPRGLLQIDIDAYRNPADLPAGRVLVVGSGQSGMSQPVDTLPGPGARLLAGFVATGHGGGHDLSLRTLRAMGVVLVGHLLGASDGVARFADDLVESAAWGDERFRMLTASVPRVAAEHGMAVPEIPKPAPFGDGGPTEVDLKGFGAVVFTTGFRPDYGSLAPWPEVFDPLGFPIHRDGMSLAVPGLSFVGVHFLRTRMSSLLLGVGEDAEVISGAIEAWLRS